MSWFTKSGAGQRRLLRFFREHHTAVLAAVALGVFILTQLSWFENFTPLARMELRSLDFRFELRGDLPPAPEIAIVGVMTSSFDPSNIPPEDRANSEALRLISEQPTWPWDRKVFALLIERLFDAGARVVALDIVFATARENDDALAAVLKKYQDRIVLAATFQPEGEGLGRRRMIYVGPSGSIVPVEGSNVIGSALLSADPRDGVVRRVNFHTSQLRETAALWEEPSLADMEPDNLTSLSGLAFEKFSGETAPALHDQLISYQGSAKTYRFLPVESVLADSMFLRSPEFDRGKIFENKIVFVGPVAELFHDVHLTPCGQMPGVEIHAQITASLLRNHRLSEVPPWMGRALTAAVIAIALVICVVVKQGVAEAGLLTIFGLLCVGAFQWLFETKLLVVPMVPPLFGLVSLGVVSLLFDFLVEQWERARVRGVLDRYVSRNVADRVLQDSDSFENVLRGQKRCVTALFSDIRGFTSMTEESDAEQLVTQLNEYFFKMVDSVLHEGGTLQKFIGDAIMAVWGDTHSLGRELDAEHAVRTALAMRRCLSELNVRWQGEATRPQLKTGLGVHHGEVIVGNIGHPMRMEFTVLGDGINTAARLESATKQFGVDILIGGSVEELTRGKFIYRRVDLLRLKGKMQPIEVFTPLGERPETAPAWLAEYHRGIELYRARDFDAAAKTFASLDGDSDFLVEMYRERCAKFSKSPPPERWDGSYTLTEK